MVRKSHKLLAHEDVSILNGKKRGENYRDLLDGVSLLPGSMEIAKDKLYSSLLLSGHP